MCMKVTAAMLRHIHFTSIKKQVLAECMLISVDSASDETTTVLVQNVWSNQQPESQHPLQGIELGIL